MLPRPKAILFDLDGTLTRPLLDFGLIRREAGLPPEAPILEAISALSPPEREHATRVLLAHEQRAAEESELSPGAMDLLGTLARKNIGTAIITRNSRDCATRVVAKHGLRTKVLICREDAPYKPDPAGLLLALGALHASAAEGWMVGDGHYDVAAGKAAGTATVWIRHSRQWRWGAAADIEIEKLEDLTLHLAGCL